MTDPQTPKEGLARAVEAQRRQREAARQVSQDVADQRSREIAEDVDAGADPERR